MTKLIQPSNVTKIMSALGLFAIGTFSASAQTIGYWQFDGANFLSDSSGNGNDFSVSSPGGVTQSGGDRAVFGGDGTLDTGVDFINNGSFTYEGFANIDLLPAGRSILGGEYQANDRGWELYLDSTGEVVLELGRFGGNNAGRFYVSELLVTPGNDFYFGVTVDTSDLANDTVTAQFFLQDLTVGSMLQTATVTRTDQTVFRNSSGGFSIGGREGGLATIFDGSFDEVRLSNGILAQGDLLVNSSIPEPSTYVALLSGVAFGITVMVRRRRR